MKSCLLLTVGVVLTTSIYCVDVKKCIFYPCPDLTGCEEVYDGGCCDRCAKKKGEECGGHLVTRCQTGLVCSKGYGTVVGKCVCPPPCEGVTCPYSHIITNTVDKHGCRGCKCSTECPEVKCSPCRYGYLRDSNGCNRCICRPKPCPKQTSPLCHQYCPYGNALDFFGCELCKCRTRRCQTMMYCNKYCPYGYNISDGCKTCYCRSKWSIKNAN